MISREGGQQVRNLSEWQSKSIVDNHGDLERQDAQSQKRLNLGQRLQWKLFMVMGRAEQFRKQIKHRFDRRLATLEPVPERCFGKPAMIGDSIATLCARLPGCGRSGQWVCACPAVH